MLQKITQTDNSKTSILIRLLVGAVFLSEGIQKFLFPEALGVGRFMKIGIIYPEYLAPFVGGVEILCGILLLIGLLTRFAALMLFITISVAIITTKFPMLQSSFWKFAHESRTDFSMFIGTLFLIIKGGGYWSVDFHRKKNGKRKRGR
ncbi:MAG TPA: DoxX family protein [Prolixibacteraceae bacterium]|nr:DoxX family protein [Prolixibacteraceae bacterium]